MELVIIVATITSFFSHFMIERSLVANAVSAIIATLITWMLVGDLSSDIDAVFVRNIVITVMMALAVSIVVGLIFAYHKKCS